MAKVLVSDPIADKGIEILEKAGFDLVYNPDPDKLLTYFENNLEEYYKYYYDNINY